MNFSLFQNNLGLDFWRLLYKQPYCKYSQIQLRHSPSALNPCSDKTPELHLNQWEFYPSNVSVCRTEATMVCIVIQLCNYNPVLTVLKAWGETLSILHISFMLTVTIILCTVPANWGWKWLFTCSSVFVCVQAICSNAQCSFSHVDNAHTQFWKISLCLCSLISLVI